MLDCDASSAVKECLKDRISAGGSVMAPSPDQDTAPKAPDKPRHEKNATTKEKSKDDKTLSDLNDGELKGLLDEALNYKNPKDREGKSKLFNHLLSRAEEDERNARASRAGGSELVRYCNPSAKRNSRHRKKPSSISENMMHGGSLDNLAKEELFETSKHRTKKSVSARQREGGSLPCNVNASATSNLQYQFLEEARRIKEMTEKKQFNATDLESERLLEHDCLAKSYQEQATPVEIVHYPVPQQKFTSRATFQVNNVDDPIQVSHLDQPTDRKTFFETKLYNQKGNTFLPNTINRIQDDGKKVDENGNALQQNAVKTKKKKVLTDKNVVVCSAEMVEGHRSDIINDMDKLMEFIGITPDHQEKNNRSIKSKQLNRHSSEDAASKSKKQRAHFSKSKDNRSKLKKSNSLSEISTSTNLEDFDFNNKDKVVLRNNKNITEKPRERRSWGNMEPMPLQTLYTNASAENLETAEFRVVTKKKKSKKRRNSISGRTKTSSIPSSKTSQRGPSPDPRRKSACSVPHSEKSNDSSDVDSVHSLPIDRQRLDMAAARLDMMAANMPVSYADMAKNNEQKPPAAAKKVPKENFLSGFSEGVGNVAGDLNLIGSKASNCIAVENNFNNAAHNSFNSGQQNLMMMVVTMSTSPNANSSVTVNNNANIAKNNHNNNNSSSNNNNNNYNNNSPPDVHNIKNFPAITKQVAVQVNVVDGKTVVNKTSNKVVVKSPNSVASKSVQVQNNVPQSVIQVVGNHNSVQNDFMMSEDMELQYSNALPPDIPDVQTIEKLQRINQGHPPSSCFETGGPQINDCCNSNVDCDMSERTNVDDRPPVVILSGLGNSKEVPGLVFGFDINEQLLSEDGDRDCCEDFIARYVAPETYNTTTSHNHDKIVNFIGAAWEEALSNVSSGKVQFYTDLL